MSDEDATVALPAWPSRRTLGLALLLGAAAGAFLISQGLQPSDDAYITFRHAKNLALHGWPAWNLGGTPVLGSTSPAWMFLLGGLGAIFGPERIEAIALGANAVIAAGSVVLACLIAYDLVERALPALLAAALIGFNGVNVYVFSLGFEAALLLLVVLGCLYALRRDQRLVCVLLASAAPLVRPEGLLLTPIVWGVLLTRRRATPKLAAAFAALPLVWLVFASAFYGSPVPHSIVAKQSFGRIYRPYTGQPDELVGLAGLAGLAGLVERLPAMPATSLRMWQRRLQPVLFQGRLVHGDWSPRDRAHWWIALIGLVALVPLLLRGGDRYAYALYPVGFLLLHGWLGALAIWYLPSFLGLATLLLYTGCAHGLARIAKRFAPGRGLQAASMLTVFLLFVTSNEFSLRRGSPDEAWRGPLYARDARGPVWEGWERERFEGYRAAAQLLNEMGAHEPALISEVGVFGYFYDGPVIDAVGLCSPEALQFYPPPRSDLFDERDQPFTTANNIVPSRMIEELRPTYVVNSLTYLEHLIRPGSAFSHDYQRIADTGRAWQRPIAIYGFSSSSKR